MMKYVNRYDVMIMLMVAWLACTIFTAKLRRLLCDAESRAEKLMLSVAVGIGVALVTFCTASIVRLACGT